ncbi:alpha/beta fold hydrolase [Streptomyces naphthomycinicus]|uniref:alpha/beta fold hydrolase n=1 Tax=Streptomyces naphthomycinicus TaxID=2872625 RepID=UPI001CECDF11|nr:alpha/beta hydrolase [Streptomyces sp. TML10]
MPELHSGDADLVYTRKGAGEPVLLITGSGGRARMWDAHQVPALLRAGYQTVTFDQRGSGPGPVKPFGLDDMVADAARLIEALGLAPCRVVGVSLGAIVAQELALRRPALLRQAVFIATRGRTDAMRRAMVTAEIEQSLGGPTVSAAHRGMLRAMQNLSQSTLADDSRAENWMALMEGPLDASEGYRYQLESTLVPNRLRDYAGIRVPCAVISFGDDLVTPPHLGREVAEAVEGCHYVEIPRCGHFGHLEDPRSVNDALTAFFATSPAARVTG